MKNRAKVHKSKEWTEEEEQFILDRLYTAPSVLAREFNKIFEKRSYSSVMHKRQRLMGVPPQRGTYTYWTEEEEQYLREHGPYVPVRELSHEMSAKFGRPISINSIDRKKWRMGIRSIDDGRIKKGQHLNVFCEIPKGENHPKWVPLGTVQTRNYGGYTKGKYEGKARYCPMIKVKGLEEPNPNNRWQTLARYNWEQANGPIPEGHVLRHIDGDLFNCDLDNLMLVTQAENAMINIKGLCEFGEEGLETAQLLLKIYDKDPELKKVKLRAREKRKEKRNAKLIRNQ